MGIVPRNFPGIDSNKLSLEIPKNLPKFGRHFLRLFSRKIPWNCLREIPWNGFCEIHQNGLCYVTMPRLSSDYLRPYASLLKSSVLLLEAECRRILELSGRNQFCIQYLNTSVHLFFSIMQNLMLSIPL